MHEFDFIIQEVRDIFAFYKIDFKHPHREEVLHDKDNIHRLNLKIILCMVKILGEESLMMKLLKLCTTILVINSNG